MKTRLASFVIFVLAILILVVGYVLRGIPMVAAISIGYFLVWKAINKFREKQEAHFQERYEEDEE